MILIDRLLRLFSDPDCLGPELDHIASQKPDHDPLFAERKPKKRAAVVASMRNEGIIILEWIAHYRALGFDSIIIYTNGNTDGSDQLLMALHKAGFITLIKNETQAGLSAQWKAYRHAFWYSPIVWDHEWVAFLDADEFMIPLVNGRIAKIHNYVTHITSTYGCSAVCLHWKWFPGRELERGDGMLFDRFRQSGPDGHVKTLFRLRDATDVTIHHPRLKDGCFAIDASGRRLETISSHRQPPTYTLGQINHYWNRSFEEFAVKLMRGRGASLGTLPWDSYFRWGCPPEHATTDPLPDAKHRRMVRREIARLMRYRRIRSAAAEVERWFQANAAACDVARIYAETKAAWLASLEAQSIAS